MAQKSTVVVFVLFGLLLPLNDLHGEIRGLTGRNILKQQLQTGKIDMPSMSGALKDSGVANFGLEDETKCKQQVNAEQE